MPAGGLAPTLAIFLSFPLGIRIILLFGRQSLSFFGTPFLIFIGGISLDKVRGQRTSKKIFARFFLRAKKGIFTILGIRVLLFLTRSFLLDVLQKCTNSFVCDSFPAEFPIRAFFVPIYIINHPSVSRNIPRKELR